MKIAIVTNFLYPEGLGGTELYCHQLGSALAENGNEVYWFVPNFNKTVTQTDQRKNYEVVKFAGVDESGIARKEFVSASFIKEMQDRQIPVAHFNEFGGFEGISEHLLYATKQAGIATIVTLHLANYFCSTGTLRYAGAEPCNGKLVTGRCLSCYGFSRATSNDALNLLLTRVFTMGLTLIEKKKVKLIPQINKLMAGFEIKHAFVRSLQQHADIVITLTDWFRQVLIVNGISKNKLEYVEQVSPEPAMPTSLQNKEVRKNFVYVGRLNKEKGIELLLASASNLMKHLPDVKIDIYGPYHPNDTYAKAFMAKLDLYPNIRYIQELDPAQVWSTIDKYKAVILPSLVAEMAPLIIMEANKLRVPVIASDVPGSAELIKQHDCGLVFKYNCTNSLIEKIVAIEKGGVQFSFIQSAINSFQHIALKYHEIYQRMAKEALAIKNVLVVNAR